MEIDLNELELHEKQLAERRRLRQKQQEQQPSTQTDGSSGSSVASTSTAMAATTTTTTTSQNVDEIDAYLDRLALDLQAKDQRTNDARGANTSNHSNHTHQHTSVHKENSSQFNDDCDKNGWHADATAAPSNSSQAPTKTTLPLLIYAFLSLLAYVNTIRCKIYKHKHKTIPFMPHNFLTIFPFCFFVFVILPPTRLCRFLIVTIHPFCVVGGIFKSVSDVIKGKFCAYQPTTNNNNNICSSNLFFKSHSNQKTIP